MTEKCIFLAFYGNHLEMGSVGISQNLYSKNKFYSKIIPKYLEIAKTIFQVKFEWIWNNIKIFLTRVSKYKYFQSIFRNIDKIQGNTFHDTSFNFCMVISHPRISTINSNCLLNNISHSPRHSHCLSNWPGDKVSKTTSNLNIIFKAPDVR